MRTTKILSGLAALLLSSASAFAADLGGNCCADLEERVAELEAISAHHGNRKMMVTIYGQVDYAYIGLSNSLFGSGQNGVAMNSAAPTFLGVEGIAQIPNGWKAGFRVEVQMDDRLNLSTANLALPEEVVMRTAVGWIEAPVGKVTIGHGSMASDGTGSVTVANTAVASRMLSLAPLSTVIALGYDLPFNDIRRDMVRYDTPIFGGLTASASVGNGDVPLGGPGFGVAVKDAWDVALRYAGEPTKEIRIAAAISYRDEQQSLATLVLGPTTRSTVLAGSASAMFVPLGIFANFGFGSVTGDTIWGDFQAYQIQAGVEKNFTAIGATTLFAEWGELNSTKTAGHGCNCSPTIWGLGAVQNIAGLSADVYVDYKHYDMPAHAGPPSFDQYMGGLRIKF